MTYTEQDNILMMLGSSDKENNMLGLQLIEVQETIGLAFLLIAYKEYAFRERWLKDAPSKFKKLEKILDKHHLNYLSWRNIHTLLIDNDKSQEQFAIYLTYYLRHIANVSTHKGVEIKGIEFKIIT